MPLLSIGWRVFSLPLLIVLLSYCTAYASEPVIQHHTLRNGLQLLVKEDKRAPVAVFQIWYRVGSSDESTGYTGLAHLTEHMMFKGTPSFPGNSLSQRIADNGGDQNAMTSEDYTMYYQVLARDRIELSFAIESSRMKKLTFNQTDFDNELEVVKEERRMRTEDDPDMRLYERFKAIAYDSSPYRHPVVGWMGDLDQLTRDDVLQWHKMWYRPDNAIIVIVGDVDARDMLALAKKYFADIAASRATTRKQAVVQQPIGEKRIETTLPARLPSVIMGYHVPVLDDDHPDNEAYALHVLTSLLSMDATSMLQKHLVREQRVAADSVAYYPFVSRYPDLLLISGTPSAHTSVDVFDSAVRDIVEKVQREPVSPEALQRVKNRVAAEDIFERDSLMRQAFSLGHLAVVGLPWQLDQQVVSRLSAVTAEQVQAVAKKYLTTERLTVGILKPITPVQTTEGA